ncbi:hypothetical protein KSS87_018074, partial [Heliosperma pusillum]
DYNSSVLNFSFFKIKLTINLKFYVHFSVIWFKL